MNPESGEDDDDETVIVPPVVDAEDTILVHRPVLDSEQTVIVDRASQVDAELDESTLRVAPDDEATVVVERAVDPDDTVSVSTDIPDFDDEATVIVDADATVQAGPLAEPTILLAGAGATVPVEAAEPALPTIDVAGAGSSQARASMAPPRKRRRGELQPAPVPSGFGGMPLVASGAGAVSSYRARTLLAPPRQPAPSESGAPGRLTGGVPSVGRSSRRASFVTIGVVVAAIVLLAGAVVWAVSVLIGF